MWNLVQIRCSGETPCVLIGSQLVWLLFKTSEVFRRLEKHFYQMVLNWLTSVSHVNIHRTKNKICLGNVWILSIKKFCDICTSEVCCYCFQCDQQCFLTWRFLQFLPVILTFFVFCESLTLNLMKIIPRGVRKWGFSMRIITLLCCFTTSEVKECYICRRTAQPKNINYSR